MEASKSFSDLSKNLKDFCIYSEEYRSHISLSSKPFELGFQ